MSTIQVNKFTTYKFSERELAESLIFNNLNLERLSTMRGEIAEQILSLVFNPLNPTDFGIQQSFLQGQLQVLTHLIDVQEESKRALYILAQNKPGE
jgi:hypothetical protein